MSLLQVGTLSGYGFDAEEAQKLTAKTGLQRVELDNSGTTVYIYFNSVCFSFNAVIFSVKLSDFRLAQNLFVSSCTAIYRCVCNVILGLTPGKSKPVVILEIKY